VTISAKAQASIERRLSHLAAVRDRAVIDGDTHPSDPALYGADLRARMAEDPNYFHGRPVSGDELLTEMDQAGVDMALCWQNPAVTRYGDDTGANFDALRASNAAIAAFAERNPTRVIPAGWTDPKALGLDRALDMVGICVESWGFPIVKMNPAQNAYPIDSEPVLRVVDRIVALGAVPAFHFGADTRFTPAEGLERVALRHPDHPLIGVHMGGGGGHFVESDPLYVAARALGLRRPNLFYILSAKRDTHIESALIAYASAGAPFAGNIAVGSDIPYGRMTWNFGGYRGLFDSLRRGERHTDPRLRRRPDLFDDEVVQGFMGRNLADLVMAADRRLLSSARAEAAP
jgi:predicted TIM-barrel fold metal-dependent hydrolase